MRTKASEKDVFYKIDAQNARKHLTGQWGMNCNYFVSINVNNYG